MSFCFRIQWRGDSQEREMVIESKLVIISSQQLVFIKKKHKSMEFLNIIFA
jgi:hypothetical protein